MKKIVAAVACMLLILPLFLFHFDADAIILQTKPPYIMETIPPILHTIPPVLETKPPEVTKPPFEHFTIPPFDFETKPPRTKPPEITPTPKPTKPSKTKPPVKTEKPASGQNICSLGLYFREMRPQLTDEWYFFTPIELNFDCVQVYPLIASNAYEVGELTLTIANGQLLAQYWVLDGIKINDEFLTFFENLDSVQTVNVSMLEGQEFKFNEPIDIAANFGEDTRVILYMNNAASFNNTVPGLKHFVVETYRPWMWEVMKLLD